jgi:arabinofuranan 3-O-arabinosyltransferase
MPPAIEPPVALILRPRSRYVIAWAAAAIATLAHGAVAWSSYDTSRFANDPAQARADGNFGHTLIDFAGQWVMARMVVTDHGRELYHRSVQRAVIDESFPRADEAPQATAHDADNLYGWMIELSGHDPDQPAIGGALYPPTQALLFAPLGVLPPRTSYRLTQLSVLILAWFTGGCFALISQRRIWWPVATLFILGFPGFTGTVHLGQNSMLSLALLAAGWLLVVRQRELTGGILWGFLIYKPTWLVAFALVPLLTRRWRMLAGMIGAAAILVVATLPIVGVASWFDWLRIGREAARIYELEDNWIFLSRAVVDIPRRWLLDFSLPLDQRGRASATIAGWVLWGFVVAVTVAIALKRRISEPIGFGPAFVGLAAWLTCYHFIYYDSLLAALPVFLLVTRAQWTAPRFNLRPFVLTIVVFLSICELAFAWLAIDASMTVGLFTPEGAKPVVIEVSTKQRGTPWDTFALLALWGYCGVNTLTGRGTDARESLDPAAD